MSYLATDPVEVLSKAVAPPQGEWENYALGPDSKYELWPYPQIYAVGTNEYKARVLIQQKGGGDFVAFNSTHGEYVDAERAIASVCDSFMGVGKRRLYNIVAETTSTSSSGTSSVTETRVHTWMMKQFS